MKQKLINLSTFRKDNNIKQSELGKYLGVSGSFISLIERDNAQFTDEKIDKILNCSAKDMGWTTDSLVPAYSRLMKTYELYGTEASLDDFLQAAGIDPQQFANIKHGKIGISPALAETIARRLPRLGLNEQWLVDGTETTTMPHRKDTVQVRVYIENGLHLSDTVRIDVHMPALPRTGDIVWLSEDDLHRLEIQACKSDEMIRNYADYVVGKGNDAMLNLEDAQFVTSVVIDADQFKVHVFVSRYRDSDKYSCATGNAPIPTDKECEAIRKHADAWKKTLNG